MYLFTYVYVIMYVCSYLFLTISFVLCIIILFSYNNLCIKLDI